MRILFACHRFPFPPNRGGKIRPFNMIRHLGQKHEIVVASLAHTQQELDDGEGLKQYCAEIYAEVVPVKLRWLEAIRALPTTTPSSVAYFHSSRLRQSVEEAAGKNPFDAVLVHCAFAAQYAIGILAKFRLLDFGDLDSGKWFDYEKSRSFPFSVGYGLETWKLRRYEKQIAEMFDYCTLTTPGELEEFNKLEVSRPHSVVPNGVDTSYFHPNGRHNSNASGIVFVGRMDYFPNIDAALYFTKRIFPIVRKTIPDVEFRIVGSNPVLQVRRLQKLPGVTVTGHVSDVRPYLKDAAVSIAPLRIARGTQNKILESMASGIPTVATPQAAKGVQCIPGEHLLVAEGPGAFAEQVVKAIQNATLRQKLSEAGRRQVEHAHAWPFSMQIVGDILEQYSRCDLRVALKS
jgi:sugar transferase (PEP-CTERM/EpsH1 system associated)